MASMGLDSWWLNSSSSSLQVMLLEEQSPLFVLDTDYDSAMNGGRVFIDAILLIPQSPGGVTFSPFGLLTPKIEGFCILALGEKHFTTYTVFF